MHPRSSDVTEDAQSSRRPASGGALGKNTGFAQTKLSAASQAPMTPAALALSTSHYMTPNSTRRVPSYMRATESSSSMKKKADKADK